MKRWLLSVVALPIVLGMFHLNAQVKRGADRDIQISNKLSDDFEKILDLQKNVINNAQSILAVRESIQSVVEEIHNLATTTQSTCTALSNDIKEVESVVEEVENKPDQILLEDSVAKTMQGVVHISCPEWQGSGFVIDKHTIATARHVVEGVKDFEITFSCGNTAHATRAISSKEYDVGFIWVEEELPDWMVEKLGSLSDCRLGQSVFAIGSSLGKQHFNNLTSGIISSLFLDVPKFGCPKSYGWSVLWQVDAATYPGNSGCPIFTLDGKVRGVLVGGYDDYESISYCVPVDVFMKDLEIIKLLFAQDKYQFERVKELENKIQYLQQQISSVEYSLENSKNAIFEILNELDKLKEDLHNNQISIEKIYEKLNELEKKIEMVVSF